MLIWSSARLPSSITNSQRTTIGQNSSHTNGTIRDSISGGRLKRREIIPFRIQGIDVTQNFGKTLLSSLDKRKSSFLFVSEARFDDSIEHTHYYLEGFIDITVDDRTSFATKTIAKELLRYSYLRESRTLWRTQMFEYEVYHGYYQVNVVLKASLYLTANDEKIAEIPINENVKESVVYRGSVYNLPREAINIHFPPSYMDIPPDIRKFDRDRIIHKAIKKAASTLSWQVIDVIDKDNDPFSLNRLE